MSQFAIRLSILISCATALVIVPAIAPAKAQAAQRHTHIKKHRVYRHHLGAAWQVRPSQPALGAYAPSDQVCPGIGRSFDCKIWPPPYADDPDRKTSRF